MAKAVHPRWTQPMISPVSPTGLEPDGGRKAAPVAVPTAGAPSRSGSRASRPMIPGREFQSVLMGVSMRAFRLSRTAGMRLLLVLRKRGIGSRPGPGRWPSVGRIQSWSRRDSIAFDVALTAGCPRQMPVKSASSADGYSGGLGNRRPTPMRGSSAPIGVRVCSDISVADVDGIESFVSAEVVILLDRPRTASAARVYAVGVRRPADRARTTRRPSTALRTAI